MRHKQFISFQIEAMLGAVRGSSKLLP